MERRTYNWLNLVVDIGSALGLWVGTSGKLTSSWPLVGTSGKLTSFWDLVGTSGKLISTWTVGRDPK